MIKLISYSSTDVKNEEDITDFVNLNQLDDQRINWINIESNRLEIAHVNSLLTKLNIPETMKKEIEFFVEQDHSLSNISTKKKHEFFDGINFLKLQMISLNKKYWNHKLSNALKIENLNDDTDEGYIEKEDLYILAKNNYIITIQEGKDGDVFDDIRKYIKNNNKGIQHHKINHLFYELINAIIDQYFLITDEIRDHIEDLEQKLFSIFQTNKFEDNNHHTLLQELMAMKKTIRLLRQYTMPLKAELNEIKQEKYCALIFDKETEIYYNVVHDRIDELLADYEHCNDLSKDLLDLHMSLSGEQMNQIMKTLTIYSVVFIPLTFIAGLYGMNFENMPELHAEYGYFITVAAMIFVGITLVWYIKYVKKWA